MDLLCTRLHLKPSFRARDTRCVKARSGHWNPALCPLPPIATSAWMSIAWAASQVTSTNEQPQIFWRVRRGRRHANHSSLCIAQDPRIPHRLRSREEECFLLVRPEKLPEDLALCEKNLRNPSKFLSSIRAGSCDGGVLDGNKAG